MEPQGIMNVVAFHVFLSKKKSINPILDIMKASLFILV